MDCETLVLRFFGDLRNVAERLFGNYNAFLIFENEISKKLDDKVFKTEDITEIVNVINTVLIGVSKQNAILENNLKSVVDLLKPNIQYFPRETHNSSFKYIHGNPWNLWIQDIGNIDELNSALKKCKYNELKKLSTVPDINDYVYYVERKQTKRGKVVGLLVNNRIKLQDVDTCCMKWLDLVNVYEIDSTSCTINALGLNCCLTEDFSDERLWTDDLGEVFENVLTNGTIYINIIKQLNDSPLFLVNMQLKDEEACINVNEWIFGRLVPELRGIFDKNLKPVADYLSPEAIDAYFTRSVNEFGSDSAVFQYNSDGALQTEASWSIGCHQPVYCLPPAYPLCVEENVSHCSEVHENVAECKEISCEGAGGVEGMPLFTHAFNDLCLPEVGEILNVTVTAVRSMVHFYVQLDDEIRSGYKQEEWDDVETLMTLTKSLNTPANVSCLKKLTTEPKMSQLVIAKDDGNTNKWYRAQICEYHPEFSDKGHTVCYVDYGVFDSASLENMRLIEETHLHLPFQAIECQLAGAKLKEDKNVNDLGMFIFGEQFVGKHLQIEVLHRSGNILYVKLVVPMKGDVAEWFYSRGLCDRTV